MGAVLGANATFSLALPPKPPPQPGRAAPGPEPAAAAPAARSSASGGAVAVGGGRLARRAHAARRRMHEHALAGLDAMPIELLPDDLLVARPRPDRVPSVRCVIARLSVW